MYNEEYLSLPEFSLFLTAIAIRVVSQFSKLLTLDIGLY